MPVPAHGAVAPATPGLPAPLTATLSDTLSGRSLALAQLGDVILAFAVNLAIALAILLATVWIARWAARLAHAGVREIPRLKSDETLADFVASLARYAVVIVGLIAVLHRLGFETTSIITVLGAASLAIGLALQGALSNVAAGVMVLLFRPYRVGDTVTMAGKTGTVKRLDLFNTEMSDADGLKVFVPNAKGFGDVIINYSDIPSRRIELSYRIAFEGDVDKAMAALLAAAAAEPRLLPAPAPWSKATDLQPDAVIVTLRVWTKLDRYWDTRFDLLKAARDALDAAGVAVAYPTPTPAPPAAPGPTPHA